MVENPKVSVCMITYNHEKFIAQAIESVLMQSTDFNIEILIGEDCSTDNTRAIIQTYVDKYPETIIPIFPTKNVGMIRNFVNVIEASRGKYVAMLEGDDFWNDKNKLQIQYDILEKNNSLSGCFHDMNIHFENKNDSFIPLIYHEGKTLYNLTDILVANFTYTASLMYVNRLFPKYPEEFNHLSMGDWPLNFLNLQYGDYYFINAKMGTYRIHENSVWSSQHKINKYFKMYEVLRVSDIYSKFVYKKAFDETKSQLFVSLLRFSLLHFEFFTILKIFKIISNDNLFSSVSKNIINRLKFRLKKR